MIFDILMGLLGLFYIAAGVALCRNRSMTRPVVMMLAAPLFLAGGLRLLDLVSVVPIEFHMLAQILFLGSIILVSTTRRSR